MKKAKGVSGASRDKRAFRDSRVIPQFSRLGCKKIPRNPFIPRCEEDPAAREKIITGETFLGKK